MTALHSWLCAATDNVLTIMRFACNPPRQLTPPPPAAARSAGRRQRWPGTSLLCQSVAPLESSRSLALHRQLLEVLHEDLQADVVRHDHLHSTHSRETRAWVTQCECTVAPCECYGAVWSVNAWDSGIWLLVVLAGRGLDCPIPRVRWAGRETGRGGRKAHGPASPRRKLRAAPLPEAQRAALGAPPTPCPRPSCRWPMG